MALRTKYYDFWTFEHRDKDWQNKLNENIVNIDRAIWERGKNINAIDLLAPGVPNGKVLKSKDGKVEWGDCSGGGGLGSKVYVVAEEGGNFTDIRTALDNVESGDVLLINPKDSNWNLTYNFTTTKRFSLKGYGIWDSVIYPEQNQNSVFIASGWNKPSLLSLSSLRLGGNPAIDIDIFGFALLRIDSCSIAGIKFHTGYGSRVEIYNSEISYTSNFSALDLKVKDYGSATNVEIRNSVFNLDNRGIEVSCDGSCEMVLINTYFFVQGSVNYVVNKTGQYDLNIYVSNCATNANYLVNPDSEGTVNIYDLTL